MPMTVPTAPTLVPATRNRRASMPARAPIEPRMAISRTFDSTIMVSDAMMLKAATRMISTSSSEIATFCVFRAVNRLWFSSCQSTTR